jgi:hypothetical protein
MALVVKYGRSRDIRIEQDNVRKYVMPLGPRAAAPKWRVGSSGTVSAIGYWMVQDPRGIPALSLAEYIRQKKCAPSILKGIFTGACGPWYQAKRPKLKHTQSESLRTYYMRQRWHGPKDNDRERRKRLEQKTLALFHPSGLSRSGNGLWCRAILAGQEVTVRDPVQIATSDVDDELWPQITRQCVTHGDLHVRNVFVVENQPCLIDFADCGLGHVFRDLATFEVSLRYDALYDYCYPGAIWRLEDRLARQPLRCPDPNCLSSRVQRAARYTGVIREQVPVLARREPDLQRAYAAALFFALLKRAGIPHAAAAPAAGADPTLPQQIAYLAAGRIAEHWLVLKR